MKKKLSKKERGEVVTKGYLEDQNYVTKVWIEKQDYATKPYVSDMFETFENRIVQEIKQEFKQEFRQHTNALMESYAHQTQIIVEALISRIERIERHVGLPSF